MACCFNSFSRDFAQGFSRKNKSEYWPKGLVIACAAMMALVKLPEQLSDQVVSQLIELDGKLELVDTREASDLAMGIVAVIGRSGDPKGMAHLRRQFEADPDRRAELAMGLAQHPGHDNWPLQIRSLAIVDGVSAQEVLTQLARSPEKPAEPEPYRQVILCGLKLGDNGGAIAIPLLEKWTSKQLTTAKTPVKEALAAWQAWFHDTYPDLPAAELPVEIEGSRWSYEELLAYLTNPDTANGSPEKGKAVFEKAPVHQVPPLRSPRRRGRTRSDHGQPAIPKERNSAVGPVSLARDFRPVREQDHHDSSRQGLHRHRRPERIALPR